MSGKKGTAPCGHPGEHIIGNYVRCDLGCDTGSWRPGGCPKCRSANVDRDFDLGSWYFYFNPSAQRVNTRCRDCGHCWVRS